MTLRLKSCVIKLKGRRFSSGPLDVELTLGVLAGLFSPAILQGHYPVKHGLSWL